MPAGRGRMRGGGGRRRQRVMSFLQPCLLLMLTREEGHGYILHGELNEFGFNPDRSDPSLIYRALREMEVDGWVMSQWDDDSFGPRRRVYRITREGKNYLKGWMAELRQTRQEIDTLIAAYEQTEADYVK